MESGGHYCASLARSGTTEITISSETRPGTGYVNLDRHEPDQRITSCAPVPACACCPLAPAACTPQSKRRHARAAALGIRVGRSHGRAPPCDSRKYHGALTDTATSGNRTETLLKMTPNTSRHPAPTSLPLSGRIGCTSTLSPARKYAAPPNVAGDLRSDLLDGIAPAPQDLQYTVCRLVVRQLANSRQRLYGDVWTERPHLPV